MKYLFSFLMIFSVMTLSAQEKLLRFKYREGELFNVRSEVFEDVYINGAKNHYSEIVNKISGKVVEAGDNFGKIEARYFMTEMIQRGKSRTFQLSQDYDSVFRRDNYGLYEIEDIYYMPVVRNVPRFPEHAVSPGDQWAFEAHEVHDFRQYIGIRRPVKFPINVTYEYKGVITKDGRELDVIGISYDVYSRQRNLQSSSGLYPALFTGKSRQNLLWDNQKGRPYSYSETFEFTVLMSDMVLYEYNGRATSRFLEVEKLDKESIIDSLEKENLDNVELKQTDEGVSITLRDIKFKPDSDEFYEGEEIKLRKIAEILKRYPDRDLLITGHTALRGTAEGRLKLSQERARAVAEYLIQLGVRDAEQIITQGKGGAEPVADNVTAEGLAKNRRVEILILEN